MTDEWNDRVAAFWAAADDADPEAVLREMASLVHERPADDPEALFEWASAHDFVGREREAIPLYRAALAAGLAGDREPQAVLQLASSLRNVGDAEASIELLQGRAPDAVTGAAGTAFLALALHDVGRSMEALQAALRALAPTLPMYRRAVAAYADELTEDQEPARDGARG